MEKWKRKTVELVSALALEEKKIPAVVPYTPQKLFVSGEERPYFRRVSPRKASVKATLLWDMLAELEREPRANVHSIIVIKNGSVICEAAAPGYSTNTAHLSHSMSKTMTMLALGFLFDERKIDLRWRVVDLFPEVKYTDRRFDLMTVEHLLTMRSGVAFAELGTVTSDRWTESFFEGELKFTPGEKFAYNSMNSYILSRIVTKITGQTLSDYLRPRLLSPLSIDNFFWEESSEGASKGGFGIYMSSESWAKIGYLLLGLGMWQGEQLISRSFLMRALCTHSETSSDTGDFDYGYHIWVGRTEDEFLLNGMFGQNVWVCPKNGIVVAMNSGNNELFSRSPALDIVRKYLSGSISGKSGIGECRALKAAARRFFCSRTEVSLMERDKSLLARLGFRCPEPFDAEWTGALGTYAFPDNNSGILPLFVRVMQNNYSGGIKNFTLSRDRDRLYFTAFEGSEKYRFEVGLYSFVDTVVSFGGERYIISAAADITVDDDGELLYRIELHFPELPNVRLITLKIDGVYMKATLSEVPNQKIVESFMSNMAPASGKMGFVMALIESRIGAGFLDKKLATVFSPTLVGISTDTPGWEKWISEKSRELSERRTNENSFLTSMISRFMPPEEAEDEPSFEEKTHTAEGGLIKRLLGRFLKRDPKESVIVGAAPAEAEPERQSTPENALPAPKEDDSPQNTDATKDAEQNTAEVGKDSPEPNTEPNTEQDSERCESTPEEDMPESRSSDGDAKDEASASADGQTSESDAAKG